MLVILGLLVGGILAGQSLVKSAELKKRCEWSSHSHLQLTSSATNILPLPGDMPNATSFWGALDNDPLLCEPMEATGTATCNGDGDGAILYENIWDYRMYQEGTRYWQHLSNAQLISGSYTGSLYVAGVRTSKPGTNLPDIGRNWLFIVENIGGRMNILENARQWNQMLPEDAWMVDQKNDDGSAQIGKYTTTCGVGRGATPGCSAACSTYDVSFKSAECRMYLLGL